MKIKVLLQFYFKHKFLIILWRGLRRYWVVVQDDRTIKIRNSLHYTNSVAQASGDTFRAAPLQSAALGLGLVGLGQDTALRTGTPIFLPVPLC